MIKIVIINHTFQKPEFYKRWKSISEIHEDLDVTLLAPVEWTWGAEKTLTYGSVDVISGSVVEENRFRIHLIDVQKFKIGDWHSDLLEKEILDIKPDIVYFIGGHTAYPLIQILNLRRREHLRDMRVIAFSMRGHTSTLAYHNTKQGIKSLVRYIGKIALLGPKLIKFNRECDAVFCHYPDAFDAFRKDGFKKPIYIQTQVGVDPDIFYPNRESRNRIRKKYDIGDAYLFGSASRFNSSKGLNEIISALPSEGNWKYLMMGWGRDDEVECIKKAIYDRGLQDKIILTGFIDNWTDMAAHWNALDCAVHAPLTTPSWEETFSLALVQAMITGLPVIGSSSGSVPYQIGPHGIIVEEGNISQMRKHMIRMIESPEEGIRIGKLMRERALNSFSIYHLNELFYRTIIDIMNEKYDQEKIDMAEFRI